MHYGQQCMQLNVTSNHSNFTEAPLGCRTRRARDGRLYAQGGISTLSKAPRLCTHVWHRWLPRHRGPAAVHGVPARHRTAWLVTGTLSACVACLSSSPPNPAVVTGPGQAPSVGGGVLPPRRQRSARRLLRCLVWPCVAQPRFPGQPGAKGALRLPACYKPAALYLPGFARELSVHTLMHYSLDQPRLHVNVWRPECGGARLAVAAGAACSWRRAR